MTIQTFCLFIQLSFLPFSSFLTIILSIHVFISHTRPFVYAPVYYCYKLCFSCHSCFICPFIYSPIHPASAGRSVALQLLKDRIVELVHHCELGPSHDHSVLTASLLTSMQGDLALAPALTGQCQPALGPMSYLWALALSLLGSGT